MLPERAAVGKREVLDVGDALVRGLDEAEDARTLPATGGHEGLDRVAAEVRIDGHRIGERHAVLTRSQVRGRVGARGRPDVAALRVRDDDQARGARVGADVLERPHAVGAERLEERKLGLDPDRVLRNRVDHAAAEALAGVRGLRAPELGLPRELERQELGHGIEPDEELASLPLHRLGKAIAERRHAHSGAPPPGPAGHVGSA